MTTIMLKTKGIQNDILERMVSLKSDEILKFVDKLTEQKRMSPEDVAAEIERAKNDKDT